MKSQRSQSNAISQLSTRTVTVSFGGNPVLKQVTASINPGEVVGIVGPNGSGKTTLLRAMAGLAKVESGQVLLDQAPIREMTSGERARRIGYMPQSVADHAFTALEFVMMGRYPHLGRFQVEGQAEQDKGRAAMKRTGTLEFAQRRLQSLSGGEKQRVSLARLLAQEPGVLLLDEPTASLDMQHQLLTMAIAREEARRGVAVAVVLHDLSLAARHCDRLLLLQDGRLVDEGMPWDVITQSNLRNIFSVDAAVEPEPITRQPMVSVLGITSDSYNGEPRPSRIHIICGAGSGRDLMHRLTLDGYELSACVLGEGDADRETANRLDIEHIASSPFSVISLDQHAAHLNLVRQADIVVVCEMAVGAGNLRNLEAAAEARRLLLINRPEDAQWDYTNGYASQVYRELQVAGRQVDRDEVSKVVAELA